MIIKVCGMREAENIREVEKLRVDDQKSGMSFGIDMMGFIFAPKSSRYVAERPAYLPTRVKKVGVFVNASIDEVVRHIEDFGLDLVQLHGQESPDFIRQLRATHPACIIKVFNVATASDLDNVTAYEGIADYFLFDTKGKLAGGNGMQFDWSVLTHYRGNTPFLLSGGIGPDDADCVKTFRHPKFIGIDLNSRFELSPALKDITTLREFIKKIRL